MPVVYDDIPPQDVSTGQHALATQHWSRTIKFGVSIRRPLMTLLLRIAALVSAAGGGVVCRHGAIDDTLNITKIFFIHPNFDNSFLSVSLLHYFRNTSFWLGSYDRNTVTHLVAFHGRAAKTLIEQY